MDLQNQTMEVILAVWRPRPNTTHPVVPIPSVEQKHGKCHGTVRILVKSGSSLVMVYSLRKNEGRALFIYQSRTGLLDKSGCKKKRTRDSEYKFVRENMYFIWNGVRSTHELVTYTAVAKK